MWFILIRAALKHDAHAIIAQIPKTQKKLREAKFFLGRMSEAGRSLQLDKEDFDFYLSAFFSASRSVTFFLQSEQKDSTQPWRWRSELDARGQRAQIFRKDQS